MKYKILVTPKSFGKGNDAPYKLLQESDCEVIKPESALALNELLKTADGVIAGLEEYDKELLESCKNLKVISRYGVGYDGIDMESARRLGIKVTITPGANSDSVADLALALMLSAARHVPFMDVSIKAGAGERPQGLEIWHKTLGIIGTGKIGKGVMKRTSGFEMRFLCYDTFKDEAFVSSYGGKYVDLETLLRESDVITIHSPLTAETQNMISTAQFALMKKTAIIVNTARGGIINEAALYESLKNGRIFAAGLDATEEEPPTASPLCKLSNCILTPHAGAATTEATYNMGMLACNNLLEVLNTGTCVNLAG